MREDRKPLGSLISPKHVRHVVKALNANKSSSSPPPPLSPLLPVSSASPLTHVTRKRRSRCARPASVACQPLPFVRLSLTHQASLHSSCFHSFAISISSLPLPYPSCSLCSHRFMFAAHRKVRNPSPLLGLSPSFLFFFSCFLTSRFFLMQWQGPALIPYLLGKRAPKYKYISK